MNVTDIIILLILLFFAIKGLISGLIKEIAGSIAIILGLYLAVNFSSWLAKLIVEKDWFEPQYLEIICFVIIFLGVLLLVIILSKWLNRFVSAIKIQWLNKVAGLLAGGLKGLLIIGGLCYVINKIIVNFAVETPEVIVNSRIYPELLSTFEGLFL